MLHLIKLELKKGRFSAYVWGALIAYALIAAFMATLYLTEGTASEEPAFRNYEEMLRGIDTIVRATFIVYAAVLLAKLVVNEFKDKTISLLFAYPVSRKKIILAKLSMVFGWTFANVLLANAVVGGLLIAINARLGHMSDPLTAQILYEHGIFVLMQAFGAAGTCLLPLVIGLRKKSVATTVVSSILIVIIVCSNNGGFNLSSVVAVPVSLGLLGILGTFMSFRNIDRVDVG
ncbi:ABC transporter permease [Cohnella sp. GbtcB17]|uniref:ABC transporter permease n=1 Tax=Cohnella sp. GbtcB17 TaxID=2824762 RepID=UPI001C2F2DD7|nr:ABC transporter permease [Cohnella sp. GbtcB17]